MDNLLEEFQQKYSTEQSTLFAKAIDYSKQVHSGQLRESGEPYFIHPEAVAKLVMEMGMDAESVTAAILHDVVEDGEGVSIEDIERNIGKVTSMYSNKSAGAENDN